METDIFKRIASLGGNTKFTTGTIVDQLLSVVFDTVLYRKPKRVPWDNDNLLEPIPGTDKIIQGKRNFFLKDAREVYDELIKRFFRITEEPLGQFIWQPKLFTPFTIGTDDYDEWNEEFAENPIDLAFINPDINGKTEFLQLMFSYGYPDHYYVCLDDPNPENPIVFGTDHEVFFSEFTNEGTLEEFLQSFMTREEFTEIIRLRMNQ